MSTPGITTGMAAPSSIADAIQKVLDQKPPRPALLGREDETYLYNDETHGYDLLPRIVKQAGTVSNIESFSPLVLEEYVRRESKTGEWGTVTFSKSGARFSPDDRVRRDSFLYTRQASDQWKTLTDLGLRMQGPTEFVRVLQKLRPSIVSYQDVIRSFRKIRFDTKTQVLSTPILTEGRAGTELSIELQLSNGNLQDTAIPSEIKLRMPYAHGSRAVYDFTVEVDAALKEEGEKKTFLLGLIFPDRQNVEDQAIANEVQAFRNACEEGGLDRLLILEDY